jgi:hypothetical protein
MKVLTQGIRLLLHVATQGMGGGELVDLVSNYYADPTKALQEAVQKANADALLAVDLALRPDWMARRFGAPLASGPVRAAWERMRGFIDGEGEASREACLAELAQARAQGLFELQFDDRDLALAVGLEKVEGLQAVLDQLDAQISARAEALRDYPSLARLLLRNHAGEPLLVGMFNFLLEQAIRADAALHETLQTALMQASRLADISPGERAELTAMRGALERIPVGLNEAFDSIRKQIQADMERMLQEARAQSSALGGGINTMVPRLTHIIEDEHERRLVREMLKRYRELPVTERHKLPELPTVLGTLHQAIGDTDAADALFREAGDPESTFKRFRNFLENERWDEAKACIVEAAAADSARYALFPSAKYELERIIGCGGFGVALLCRHRHLEHQVVIKALLARRTHGDAELIVREGRILKTLSHPAIIGIEDSDYADAEQTRPYLVLEFFPDSCSLAEWVGRDGALAIDDALGLARTMAEALATAHGAGVLHRDITPENLLVRRNGDTGWQIKLIDFGLAARRENTRGVSERYRATLLGDSPLGKLDYGAPEQMIPNGKVGRFTDVFGFGKTLCFALFGRPNPTLNDWERIGQHHPFVRLLNRCIHEDAGARPQDFQDVLAALVQRDAEHVLIVDRDGAGDFESLAEAVAAAAPGTRIQVHPGCYQGPIRIDQALEIVGESAAADIRLVADGEDAVTFSAERGLIANLSIVQRGSGEFCALVVQSGRLEVEGCDLSSRGSQPCVLILGNAEALLTRNRIHDGAAGGVVVCEDANCTLTFNQIYGHARTGLEAQDQAQCQARGNDIRDGQSSGVLLCHRTRATLAENRIHGNQRYGVVVGGDAELSLIGNRINGNRDAAVAVLDNARCRSSGNDLSGNRNGAWHPDDLSAARLTSDADSEPPARSRDRY